MRETLGVPAIRLFDPPGQRLVRKTGINADDRQTALGKLPRQPDRHDAAFVHNALRIWGVLIDELSDLIGIRSRRSTAKDSALTANQPDRNLFDGYI